MVTLRTEVDDQAMTDPQSDSGRGGARRTAWILLAVAAGVYLTFVGSAVLR